MKSARGTEPQGTTRGDCDAQSGAWGNPQNHTAERMEARTAPSMTPSIGPRMGARMQTRSEQRMKQRTEAKQRNCQENRLNLDSTYQKAPGMSGQMRFGMTAVCQWQSNRKKGRDQSTVRNKVEGEEIKHDKRMHSPSNHQGMSMEALWAWHP